ncbi:MAG: hypothetical protein JKY96_04510 [Phycisphaerales bacterium]|nr:hypothetical protein [Phycisphaerales bacterium]
MPVAAIGAVASVAGGAIAGSGARGAARSQARAARSQIEEERRQFNETKQDLAPYREAGQRGLEQYDNLINSQSDYEGLIQSNVQDPFQFGAEEFEQYKDPGYEFRLAEGARAVNNTFANLGKRVSGERFAGLQNYAQNAASQEFRAARGRAAADYDNQGSLEQQTYNRGVSDYDRQYTDVLNRQGNLAQLGVEASAQQIQARQQSTSGINQAIGAQGAAQAAGRLGQTGAVTSALGDLGNAFRGGVGGGFSLPNLSQPSYSSTAGNSVSPLIQNRGY